MCYRFRYLSYINIGNNTEFKRRSVITRSFKQYVYLPMCCNNYNIGVQNDINYWLNNCFSCSYRVLRDRDYRRRITFNAGWTNVY